MIITTDNKYRNILYGCELTEKEKEQFDYLDDAEADFTGFRYKGDLYDLGEFMRIENNPELKNWDGISNHTYFSGILVKYSDCGDGVKVGTYCS